MFTGIVQNLGEVKTVSTKGDSLEVWIRTTLPKEALFIGNSIAVNGVCLTVESYEHGSFKASIVKETLERSTLSHLKPESFVNLELPLKAGDFLGGHFVLGHVDFHSKVLQAGTRMEIEIPQNQLKFFPEKGSICIEGVSLTIAKKNSSSIEVALIPETLKSTTLGSLKAGDFVNIEIDSLARYLDSLIK